MELKAQSVNKKPADQNIEEQNAEEEEGENLEAAGSVPHSKEKDDEIHPKVDDNNGESGSVEEVTKVPTGLIQEPEHDFDHPISSKPGVETRKKSNYFNDPIVPINETRIEDPTTLDEDLIPEISKNSDEIQPIPMENIKLDAPSDSVSMVRITGLCFIRTRYLIICIYYGAILSLGIVSMVGSSIKEVERSKGKEIKI